MRKIDATQMLYIEKRVPKLIFLVVYVCLITVPTISAQNPPSNLSGTELREWLKENYYDGLHTTLGYDGVNGARSYMYNIIDNHEDTVACVYGGHKEYRIFDLTRAAGTSGMTPINCEHSIPQSFFSASEPMKSDIHHLYPTYQNWNSTRQAFPFGDIDDAQTTKWMFEDASQTTIPTSDIEQYSEFKSGIFEPREDHKGNLARAVFYFYTMYPTEAGSIDLLGDSCTFYQWHLSDGINLEEEERNENVLLYQGNENPYIANPGLIVRAWNLGTNAPPDLSLVSSSTTITLDWGDMPGETGYNIYRSTDSITFTQLGSTLPVNTISYEDLTPIQGTTYYYYITGVYDLEESTSSPGVRGQLTVPGPPDAVTDLALTATTTSIDLSWTDVLEETSYQIYRSTDNVTFNPLGSPLSIDVTNYSDNNAIAETVYYYYIVASNTFGSSTNSNTVNGEISVVSATASNLIISEYIEGSSFNKAIEIANFTGAPVDLSQFELGKQTNGAGSWSTLPLSGILADQSVYVVVNNSASDTKLIAEADVMTTSAVMSFNGNDPVALFDAVSVPATIVDIVGVEDAGTGNFAKDVTLVRDSIITAPNESYTTSEWVSFAQDQTDSIGAHYMFLGGVLPVELGDFSGVALDGFHRLDWETLSESNIDYFEIQESLDGVQFQVIGSVQSQGESKQLQVYEYLVSKPPVRSYYQLKILEKDGSFTFSKIITLERQDQLVKVQVWPIPAVSFVNLKIENPNLAAIELTIYSNTGQSVFYEKKILEAGINQATIPLSQLHEGFYLLELKTGQQVFQTKLIKIQE